MENSNPLVKHFRHPQLWITLPSQGKFYKENTINYPESGEIGVLSMTARDEILFKNPDALLNGEATKQVIESCVPNIKNAWAMPAIDLDAVLIAIRRATYGNEMEFTASCSHCGTAQESAVDLAYISEQITTADYSEALEVNGLKFFFKSISFFTFNQANLENFKRQQSMSILADETLSDEERKLQFTKMFLEIVNDSLATLAESIDYIITDEGERVKDQKLIMDFFQNCDKKIYDAVTKKIESINEINRIKPLSLKCNNPECRKDFKSTFTFEQSNFFG